MESKKFTSHLLSITRRYCSVEYKGEVKLGKSVTPSLELVVGDKVECEFKDNEVFILSFKERKNIFKRLYFGKVKKSWYFLKNGKEIQLIKTKRDEQWEPVFRTTLHTIPHEVTVDENKYRLLMGKMDMGDLLMNTPIKVYISSKLPQWADYKIADLALISLFRNK